ncbi:MAG: twin-arginine translocase TatA/TatE family subunit [Acidobacteriota bacterium]
MFGLGVWELSLILIVILLLFGGSKLPELGRGLGKAIKDFRRSASEPDEIDITKDKDGTPKP